MWLWFYYLTVLLIEYGVSGYKFKEEYLKICSRLICINVNCYFFIAVLLMGEFEFRPILYS
mgnify:FL=1